MQELSEDGVRRVNIASVSKKRKLTLINDFSYKKVNHEEFSY